MHLDPRLYQPAFEKHVILKNYWGAYTLWSENPSIVIALMISLKKLIIQRLYCIGR